MMEREMVDMFTNILQGHYYTACSTFDTLDELETYGEMIEVRIKIGKIQKEVSRINVGNENKSFGGYQKKKEVEASAIYARKGKGRAH